jgi:hypothetical protein
MAGIRFTRVYGREVAGFKLANLLILQFVNNYVISSKIFIPLLLYLTVTKPHLLIYNLSYKFTILLNNDYKLKIILFFKRSAISCQAGF